MHTHSAAVAAAIRSRRERLGLSQQQLADRAGLSRVSIVRYEAARSTPRLDSARAIARVLGTPVDDLLPHEEGLP
ncbi:MAG TPA: helix-turn-helix transcriptional regulator [Rhodospirillales bacterium]|nr:helix-turn-helix transcriptional regulator [Rhodospirillales bacterium]